MRYRIITASNPSDLEDNAQDGGPAYDSVHLLLVQAMTRTSEERSYY